MSTVWRESLFISNSTSKCASLPTKTYVIFSALAEQSGPKRTDHLGGVTRICELPQICRRRHLLQQAQPRQQPGRNDGSGPGRAGLYDADDYDSKLVPEMLEYCKKNLKDLGEEGKWLAARPPRHSLRLSGAKNEAEYFAVDGRSDMRAKVQSTLGN